MSTVRRAAIFVLFVNCLSIHYQIALCQSTTSTNNQAVSPPPSFFEWLQPFRPIIVVSKFPPIIEFIAQRIQTQFSNYVHEDLSRPQTYDRPTYKPYVATDSTIPTSTITPSSISSRPTTQVDITTSTEPLMIPTVAPPKLVLVDSYDLVTTTNFNQSIDIEYQLKNVHKLNQSAEDANHMDLERNVHLIMHRNNLKENITHVFEIQKQNNTHTNQKPFLYKDVSDLFTNTKGKAEFVLLRDGSVLKKLSHLIALTKIHQHVYVNVINVKNSQDT